MPREIDKRLLEIGGFTTDFGRESFLEKAAKIRERVKASAPKYADISESVFNSDYNGSISRTLDSRATKSKRKGKKMPKKITTVTDVTTVAGKRGRKSEYNVNDFVMEIGIENALDVTEEMVAGIAKLDAKDQFDPELLFSNENDDVNKYRSNRFGGLKRVAIQANGEGSKFELSHGLDENSDKIWMIVRKA